MDNKENLRLAVMQAVGCDVARLDNDDYLFIAIEKIPTDEDNFFKIMLFTQDLFEINNEKTIALLEKAFEVAEQKMGSVSWDKYHGNMGWQLYNDDYYIASICDFVKQFAIFAITHDSNDLKMTKSLFKLLSFDGRDFMINSQKGQVSLRLALDWYAPHDKIVNWLSDKYQWQRWPEFLLKRIKVGTLSRSQLAENLGVTGWNAKRKIVRLLEKDVAQKKSQRAKDPIL